MQQIFESINKVFSFVGPFSDFLWDFPTNFEWYQRIPILGNFSFAIIFLTSVIASSAIKILKTGIKNEVEQSLHLISISPFIISMSFVLYLTR